MRRYVIETLKIDIGDEHNDILGDLFSGGLDFGWQAFENATKAGTYPILLKDLHFAATGTL